MVRSERERRESTTLVTQRGCGDVAELYHHARIAACYEHARSREPWRPTPSYLWALSMRALLLHHGRDLLRCCHGQTPPPDRSRCTPPTRRGREKRREAMTAVTWRGEMSAARVFGATQIVHARAGATHGIGSTLDCGLVHRNFENFFAKCTKTDVDATMSHRCSEC